MGLLPPLSLGFNSFIEKFKANRLVSYLISSLTIFSFVLVVQQTCGWLLSHRAKIRGARYITDYLLYLLTGSLTLDRFLAGLEYASNVPTSFLPLIFLADLSLITIGIKEDPLNVRNTSAIGEE